MPHPSTFVDTIIMGLNNGLPINLGCLLETPKFATSFDNLQVFSQGKEVYEMQLFQSRFFKQ